MPARELAAAHPAPDRVISALPDERRTVVERYPNPPVLEALVDIQVEPRAELALADVDAVMRDERAAYPGRQELLVTSVLIDAQARTVAPGGNELQGYRYDTRPTGAVTQLRTGGFSFSRLPPYPRDGWDAWQPEARRLWTKYWDRTRPARVTRLAVRYINQIRVPRGEFLPQEYFHVYPHLPDALGTPITGFLLRTEQPHAGEDGATLALTQGIVQGTEPGVLTILLDLEASRVAAVSPEADTLWREIGTLHDRISTAFEACITDSTRDLFR